VRDDCRYYLRSVAKDDYPVLVLFPGESVESSNPLPALLSRQRHRALQSGAIDFGPASTELSPGESQAGPAGEPTADGLRADASPVSADASP
jgi:hypothetical protein